MEQRKAINGCKMHWMIYGCIGEEVFIPSEIDVIMANRGIGPDLLKLKPLYEERISHVIQKAKLSIPSTETKQVGGKSGGTLRTFRIHFGRPSILTKEHTLIVPGKMEKTYTYTKSEILRILSEVKDPEIPVLSLEELGIIRDVRINDNVEVIITPSYFWLSRNEYDGDSNNFNASKHGYSATKSNYGFISSLDY